MVIKSFINALNASNKPLTKTISSLKTNCRAPMMKLNLK